MYDILEGTLRRLALYDLPQDYFNVSVGMTASMAMAVLYGYSQQQSGFYVRSALLVLIHEVNEMDRKNRKDLEELHERWF